MKPINCQTGNSCQTNLPQVAATEDTLQSILSIAFGVFAAIAVVVIILAAINFATADGNADAISRSKKTIILALVGLVISLSAEALVLTVLGRI